MKNRMIGKILIYMIVSALMVSNVQPVIAEDVRDIIIEQETEVEGVEIADEESITIKDEFVETIDTTSEVLIEEIIEVDEVVMEDTVTLASQESDGTVEKIAAGQCGENAEWLLDETGILIISGTGSIECGWEDFENSIVTVIIEEGIEEIERGTFYNCKKLKTITIPSGLKKIEDFAIYDCMNLETVRILEKDVDFGEGLFRNKAPILECYKGSSVESYALLNFYEYFWITENGEVQIPNEGICGAETTWVLDENGVLTISGKGKIDGIPRSLEEIVINVVIKDGITEIGETVFAGFKQLERVSLPESIKYISSWAFIECTKLVSINIPENVTSIDAYAFYECKKLEKITIPKNIVNIGENAFFNCQELKEVEFSKDIINVDIGENAFSQCSNLTSITIPGGVKNIGRKAFSSCVNLAEVILLQGVNGIGEYAFTYCKNLNSVIIPNSVCGIGRGAFDNCTNLNSIVIPSNVTNIEEATFCCCRELKTVVLLDGIKSISDSAFASCENLFSIKIPASVTNIGSSAFYKVNLREIRGYSGSFAETFADEKGYSFVALDVGTDEKETENEDDIVIETIEKGVCGDDATWTLDSNGLLTISGTGIIECSWEDYQARVIDVVIEEGISEIAWGTFEMCSNLKTVAIPDGVTEIGSSAFSECSSLVSINIPHTVNFIGNHAFTGCESLTKFEIPEGVKTIEDGTFSYCTNLKTIEIPQTVNSIGEYAFNCCFNLDAVTIPEAVTTIGEYAFSTCRNITSLVIPNGMKEISTGLFSTCTRLTSITIPESVISIDEYAFYGSGLKKVYGYSGSIAQEFAKENGYVFVDLETGESEADEPDENIIIGGLNQSYEMYRVYDTTLRVQSIEFSEDGLVAVMESLYTVDSDNAYDETKYITYNGIRYYLVGGSGMDYTYYRKDSQIVITYGTTKLLQLISETDGRLAVSYSKLTAGHSVYNVGDILYLEGTIDTQGDEQVNNTESVILALPAVSELTVNDALAVQAARAAYEALSAEQKAQVSSEAISQLEAAEKRITELQHVHSWINGTITKAPTCKEAGVRTYYCECGQEKTEKIPQNAHNVGEWKITKIATCIDNGTKVQKCIVCQTVLRTDVIQTTGHEYGAWTTVSEATVKSEEVQKHICSICGKEETQNVGKALTPVLEIPGKLSSFNMKKGKTVKFEVSMANGDTVASVKSSKTKILKATLDKKTGKITVKGLKEGTSELTITLASGKTRTYTIKVVTGIVKTSGLSVTNVTGKKLTLEVKKTHTLQSELKPFTSTQKLTYKSSDKKIVKVSSTGKITALAPGKATITATSGSKKVKITVTVPGISGLKSSVSVKRNKTLTLKPKTYGISEKVTYTSSNAKIATVTSAGKVKGINKGTVTITIKAGPYSVKCKIKVK